MGKGRICFAPRSDDSCSLYLISCSLLESRCESLLHPLQTEWASPTNRRHLCFPSTWSDADTKHISRL